MCTLKINGGILRHHCQSSVFCTSLWCGNISSMKTCRILLESFWDSPFWSTSSFNNTVGCPFHVFSLVGWTQGAIEVMGKNESIRYEMDGLSVQRSIEETLIEGYDVDWPWLGIEALQKYLAKAFCLTYRLYVRHEKGGCSKLQEMLVCLSRPALNKT